MNKLAWISSILAVVVIMFGYSYVRDITDVRICQIGYTIAVLEYHVYDNVSVRQLRLDREEFCSTSGRKAYLERLNEEAK